eukprot:GHVT01020949.1.p1 GENE.GHVT01020949.1~~GHVT01020949.1.p1  ORF type:complete len:411 (-),score=76.02 GHVT01020949.1:642-1874(-)
MLGGTGLGVGGTSWKLQQALESVIAAENSKARPGTPHSSSVPRVRPNSPSFAYASSSCGTGPRTPRAPPPASPRGGRNVRFVARGAAAHWHAPRASASSYSSAYASSSPSPGRALVPNAARRFARPPRHTHWNSAMHSSAVGPAYPAPAPPRPRFPMFNEGDARHSFSPRVQSRPALHPFAASVGRPSHQGAPWTGSPSFGSRSHLNPAPQDARHLSHPPATLSRRQPSLPVRPSRPVLHRRMPPFATSTAATTYTHTAYRRPPHAAHPPYRVIPGPRYHPRAAVATGSAYPARHGPEVISASSYALRFQRRWLAGTRPHGAVAARLQPTQFKRTFLPHSGGGGPPTRSMPPAQAAPATRPRAVRAVGAGAAVWYYPQRGEDEPRRLRAPNLSVVRRVGSVGIAYRRGGR